MSSPCPRLSGRRRIIPLVCLDAVPAKILANHDARTLISTMAGSGAAVTLSRVVLAVDDHEVEAIVRGPGEAVMTSVEHPTARVLSRPYACFDFRPTRSS